jgi:N6-L-threonylcarbamoyladenine synthase
MIVALESSCDETAVALFDPGRGIAGEWIHSQAALHEPHGGVVPEIAAREHLRRFPMLLERIRGIPIDQVAVTRGPGLAPCLALGVAAAKALALARRVPLVGVNHLRGHAWSPFLGLHTEAPGEFGPRMDGLLPHLGLIASGGHTILFALDSGRRIRAISSTRDDAAGEALDKGAKLLGLGYPGGPLLEALAGRGRPDAYDFPRALGRRDDFDFSFSGLKTSLRYRIESMGPEEVLARRPDLAASYQEAVVDALARKAGLALESGEFRSLGLSGGVANNGRLRTALAAAALRAGVPLLAAAAGHTGDNAAMIAFAAWADPDGTDRSAGMGLTVEPGLGLAVEPGPGLA